MITSTTTTKTKALCVATRCTSVDQFVATFHRFCGDDETFFVATPTSRPIGLETPFSIQLADKQPVLRGLCIVLDAWATPENRYRRPGIRLGIKRLTADSQIVFDRLKAARSPAQVTEATPPLPPLASGTPLLGGARRTLTPPKLPPLPEPRSGGAAAPVPAREPGRPMVVFVPPREQGPASSPKLSRDGAVPAPSLARELTPPPSVAARPVLPGMPPLAEAKPALPGVPPPAQAKPALPGVPSPAQTRPATPSVPLPLAADARPALPGVPSTSAEVKPAPPGVPSPSAEARPALPSMLPSSAAKPALPSVPPSSAEARPATPPPVARPVSEAPVGEASPPPAPAPAPIAVTRFQVALHVDTVPPPVTDVEFKPQQLVSRKRAEPIVVVPQVTPAAAPSNDALPAVIMDQHGPVVAPYDTLPKPAPGAAGALLADLRTPGSDLVLPANPLHDLTDESLEGFVDCTLYEDTTHFPSATDSSEWGAPAAEPPAVLPRTTPRRVSVPAMPFDETPNLTVRALGDTESLAVAPDDPLLTRAVSGELRGDARGSGPRAVSGELRAARRDSGPRAVVGEPKVETRSGPEVVVSGELWSDARGPAPAPGELWSDARGPGAEAAPPRTQPRPETPLPRPASNAPLEPLGGGGDPASWFDSASLPYGNAAPAWQPPPADPAFAPGVPMAPGFAPAMPVDPAFAPTMPVGLPGQQPPFAASGPMVPMPAMPMSGPVDRPSGASGALAYPFADSATYPRYSAADMVALQASPGVRARPEWQRWVLIVGSVVVAIVAAFVIARLVRGPARQPPAPPSHATDSPARPAPARSAVASPAPARSAPPASARVAPTVPSASQPPAGAAADSVEPDPAELATGAADATDAPPEDDGEAVPGGPRVAGSGPCRFTVATTPAGSVVRFDDQAMGPSPITIQGSCDRHKVDVSHARYQSVMKWVVLTADKPQQLDVSLPRPIHAVTVTSFPPGAELAIGGRRAGTTPAVVQVTGFSTVALTLTKPGFRTVTRKVYSRLTPDRVFVKLMK